MTEPSSGAGLGVEVRVSGIVQGVGFRPTVYRLATRAGLAGEVRNDGAGVRIRVWGPPAAIAGFVDQLRAEPPALARIESLETRALPGPAPASAAFAIVTSHADAPRTRVAPDAAMCPACRAEIFDPRDRRHNYGFGNCTECGPRFSIITALPYDRGHTTMAGFEMCPACRAEYEDPEDRRFHAQPVACPSCGPRVWLEALAPEAKAWVPPAKAEPSAVLDAAAAALGQGAILAIRGLGGFHLACDAGNAEAVARLRAGKLRPRKPLALMVADLEMAARHCVVDAAAREALSCAAAPIVLLARREHPARELVEELAPGLDELGVMLAATPLHALLLQRVGRPLVMTSGNRSGAPPALSLDEARDQLAAIAELALMHDRPIAHRVDDSVVRILGGRPRVQRRARGYAPAPLPLPPGFPGDIAVLALGAQQKASFCLTQAGGASLSPPLRRARSAGGRGRLRGRPASQRGALRSRAGARGRRSAPGLPLDAARRRPGRGPGDPGACRAASPRSPRRLPR